MRRADIFEAHGNGTPPEMLSPPEVSHQRFGICDVSAPCSRLQMKRTSSRGSVGEVFSLVSEEHASESTISRATQDVANVDASEVVVLALSIEDCNFGPPPEAPNENTERTLCCFMDDSFGPSQFRAALCFENQVSPVVHRVWLVHLVNFCATVFDRRKPYPLRS